MGSRECAAQKNISVCAKMQIGTTHEIATVPNIPLIPNLFEKLNRIDSLGIEGLMFSWNFGNLPSINTAAIKQYFENADLRGNREYFCMTLAAEYFSSAQPQMIADAWGKFCASFAEFPFSIKMLYFGPGNYAVSYPLLLDYADRPMGPSWIFHNPFGDRLEDCMEPFSADEVCDCVERMSRLWNEGLVLYAKALTDEHNLCHVNELSCAKMISCHLDAMKNIFDFHAWRKRKMQAENLTGPCRVVGDVESTAIITTHINTLQKALKLAKSDLRLGYHQEPHEYFYTPESIKIAIDAMQK
jgi:hypothetical protein